MEEFFVYLKEYDSNEGVELRIWARKRNIRMISVAQGNKPTMFVEATEDGIKEMMMKFDWIESYVKNNLKLELIINE